MASKNDNLAAPEVLSIAAARRLTRRETCVQRSGEGLTHRGDDGVLAHGIVADCIKKQQAGTGVCQRLLRVLVGSESAQQLDLITGLIPRLAHLLQRLD